MAFDMSTAKPMEQPVKKGFDMSTAKPLEQPQTNAETPPEQGSFSPLNVAGELAAAVNRGAVNLADFLTTDQVNNILQLSGSEKRVPTIREALSDTPASVEGNFMPQGLTKDVVRGAGEVIPSAVGMGGLFRSAAQSLPSLAGGAESVGAGVLRQIGTGSIAADAGYGAASGAGGIVGGKAGEAVGGETGKKIGEAIGSFAAPSLFMAANSAAKGSADKAEDLISRINAGSSDKDLAEIMIRKREPSPFVQKLTEKISSDEFKPSIQKLIGAGSEKIVSDDIAKASIRQGFDHGIVAAIKASDKENAKKMLEMVDISQSGRANSRYAASNRPSDVAGRSLLEGVTHIKRVNAAAGKELDSVAASLKGQQVDISKPVDNFIDTLSSMGIGFKNNKPIFKNSDIEGAEGAQRIIGNLVARMKDTKVPDAYDVHRLKRYIDNQVNYGKVSEGLTGDAERVIKSLRKDLDNQLDVNFPEYNRVNSTYSDTIGALDAFQSSVGKIDLFGENASSALGTAARRLLGNAQSRAAQIDAIQLVDDVAKKYGMPKNNDIMMQVLFADELDSMFGAAAKTSLQGDVGKGVKNAIEATQGGKGVTAMAIDAVASGANKLRGINDDEAYKSIKSLLQRQAAKKPSAKTTKQNGAKP